MADEVENPKGEFRAHLVIRTSAEADANGMRAFQIETFKLEELGGPAGVASLGTLGVLNGNTSSTSSTTSSTCGS